ncbi:protein of unknown function [Bradyrhizobium vignae]|uniref:Transposase n=1 Tax=Bradyrhizobium vignae TaxID=1549949 RepID=A0A2U3QAH7_9BRAD|nr:protein of unknown function [Bradyrhizobium vignae]
MKFVLAHDKDQSMKRSRFSEEQIIGILKEHEAGVSVADPRPALSPRRHRSHLEVRLHRVARESHQARRRRLLAESHQGRAL